MVHYHTQGHSHEYHGYRADICFLAAKSCLTLLRPRGLWPARLRLSVGFPRQEYWSGWPCPAPLSLLLNLKLSMIKKDNCEINRQSNMIYQVGNITRKNPLGFPHHRGALLGCELCANTEVGRGRPWGLEGACRSPQWRLQDLKGSGCWALLVRESRHRHSLVSSRSSCSPQIKPRPSSGPEPE